MAKLALALIAALALSAAPVSAEIAESRSSTPTTCTASWTAPSSGAERERGYARDIPGIDVIVGGSTHAALDPEVVNGAVIVRAQARGAAVGLLRLEVDTDLHRVQKWSFERVPTGPASDARAP